MIRVSIKFNLKIDICIKVQNIYAICNFFNIIQTTPPFQPSSLMIDPSLQSNTRLEDNYMEITPTLDIIGRLCKAMLMYNKRKGS